MGFPKGDPSLACSESYYETLYQKGRLFGSESTPQPWRSYAARVVTWYPALALLRGDEPIYDVGCGPGVFAEMCFDLGVAYAGGIDVSATAVEFAAARIPSAAFKALPASVVPADIERATYKTAVFLEVLEHVYEDLDLLYAVPPGRTIVASVPSFHTDGHCRWFTSEDEVRQRYGGIMTIDHLVAESHQSSNWWYIWKGTRT
jgi:trans-aconitate methyltransferase